MLQPQRFNMLNGYDVIAAASYLIAASIVM